MLKDDKDPDKIYQNGFNFAQLKSFHKIFKGCEDLEEAKTQLLEILNEKKPQIEKNKNNLSFIMNILGKIITIPLKRLDKEFDLSYDSLSEEMKSIIDKEEIILTSMFIFLLHP